MDRRAYGHIQLISNSEVDGFLKKVDFGQENFKFCEENVIFALFCLFILLPYFYVLLYNSIGRMTFLFLAKKTWARSTHMQRYHFTSTKDF